MFDLFVAAILHLEDPDPDITPTNTYFPVAVMPDVVLPPAESAETLPPTEGASPVPPTSPAAPEPPAPWNIPGTPESVPLARWVQAGPEYLDGMWLPLGKLLTKG